MNNGFDVKNLVQQKDPAKDEAWRRDPIRIKMLIKQCADACGLVLKNPKPNCPKCHGRGWTGVDVNTGNPVVCRCVFQKEDLHNPEEVSPQYLRPKNRAERRAQQKWIQKQMAKQPKRTTQEELPETDISEYNGSIEEERD